MATYLLLVLVQQQRRPKSSGPGRPDARAALGQPGLSAPVTIAVVSPLLSVQRELILMCCLCAAAEETHILRAWPPRRQASARAAGHVGPGHK